MLGCIFYVHIDSFERSKLDLKSRKCAFISYDTDEFGYQFWDYENRQIIRSRDDIFNNKAIYKNRLYAEATNTNAKPNIKKMNILSLGRSLKRKYS